MKTTREIKFKGTVERPDGIPAVAFASFNFVNVKQPVAQTNIMGVLADLDGWAYWENNDRHGETGQYQEPCELTGKLKQIPTEVTGEVVRVHAL